MRVIAAICLLLLGLTLPMIDIEARIEHFEMVLLGETVAFSDQVLFHQSKSILDVVRILLRDGKPELILVAVLIFGFSVLVPASKMGLSLITLVRGREVPGKLASFLMYRAGKWSMADVMVVAIFATGLLTPAISSAQLATADQRCRKAMAARPDLIALPGDLVAAGIDEVKAPSAGKGEDRPDYPPARRFDRRLCRLEIVDLDHRQRRGRRQDELH